MFLTDKFYYISISRVATRSILRRLETLEKEFPYDIKPYNVTTFHLINEVFKNTKLPYTFAFVRNPISRCLSLYRHAKRELWFTGNFKEYVELLDCYFNNFFLKRHFDKVDEKSGYVNILQEAIPQHYYLFKDDSSTHVNFIGKYESLEEDWSIVAKNIYDRTYFDVGGTLPFLNERSDAIGVDFTTKIFIHHYTSPSEIIDDETHNLIYKIYKKDFKLLDYKKDMPPAKTCKFKLVDRLHNLIFDVWEVRKKKGEESKEFLDLWNKLLTSFLIELNSWHTQEFRLLNHAEIDTRITNNSKEGDKFNYFIDNILLLNVHQLEKTIVENLNNTDIIYSKHKMMIKKDKKTNDGF